MVRRIVWSLACVCLCSQAMAVDYGDITATFVLDGTAPAPKKLDTSKEPMCVAGGKELYDEKLTVNKENSGVKDVVVYLFLKPGEKAPEAHPDQKKQAETPVELDNTGCRFVPRIALIMTNQQLVVKNTDKFGHNTNLALIDNPAQNPNLPAGGKVEFKFAKAEKVPIPVACNIHPWMGGYVVVKDHPFMAVSDENGKLTIKNVPTGSRTFQLWHGSFISEGKQNGKAVKWERGRVTLDVKPGTNDLGEIKIPVKHFSK
jgi:hypothetical protein